MKSFSKTLLITAVCFSLAGLSACKKPDEVAAKGPAEQAGAKIDEVAAKAAVELNKLGEKAGQGLEKAGNSMQNAARDAQNRNEQK
ncbi:MAG: hypothetical protein ACRYGK_02385 [Janthinobacterium lividum]